MLCGKEMSPYCDECSEFIANLKFLDIQKYKVMIENIYETMYCELIEEQNQTRVKIAIDRKTDKIFTEITQSIKRPSNSEYEPVSKQNMIERFIETDPHLKASVQFVEEVKEMCHDFSNHTLCDASIKCIRASSLPVNSKKELFAVGNKRLEEPPPFKTNDYELYCIHFIVDHCNISTNSNEYSAYCYTSSEEQIFLMSKAGYELIDNRFDENGNKKKYNYSHKYMRHILQYDMSQLHSIYREHVELENLDDRYKIGYRKFTQQLKPFFVD